MTLWIGDTQSVGAAVGLAPAGLWTADEIAVDAGITLPSPVYLQWWNGDTRFTVNIRGWWDGTTEQPVSLAGWWDGATVQQARDQTNPNGV